MKKKLNPRLISLFIIGICIGISSFSIDNYSIKIVPSLISSVYVTIEMIKTETFI